MSRIPGAAPIGAGGEQIAECRRLEPSAQRLGICGRPRRRRSRRLRSVKTARARIGIDLHRHDHHECEPVGSVGDEAERLDLYRSDPQHSAVPSVAASSPDGPARGTASSRRRSRPGFEDYSESGGQLPWAADHARGAGIDNQTQPGAVDGEPQRRPRLPSASATSRTPNATRPGSSSRASPLTFTGPTCLRAARRSVRTTRRPNGQAGRVSRVTATSAAIPPLPIRWRLAATRPRRRSPGTFDGQCQSQCRGPSSNRASATAIDPISGNANDIGLAAETVYETLPARSDRAGLRQPTWSSTAHGQLDNTLRSSSTSSFPRSLRAAFEPRIAPASGFSAIRAVLERQVAGTQPFDRRRNASIPPMAPTSSRRDVGPVGTPSLEQPAPADRAPRRPVC